MFSGMSYSELLFFGAIALLLFGAKLPEVARTMGGKYRQIRGQLNDLQKEFSIDTYEPPRKSINYSAKEEEESPAAPQSTAPKFTPPPEDE